MSKTRRLPGPMESLQHRNFRLFAFGQFVSQVGTWMNRTAQDWLVLELSDNNPAMLGIAVAIQFAPVTMLSLWAGLLADRLDNSKLLVWLRVGQGACALALAAPVLFGVAQLWHVFTVAGVFGALAAMEVPVRQAFTAEIVGKAGIANAVGINSVVIQGSRMLGPIIAGLLITLFNTSAVFLVSALTCWVVHWSVQRMDMSELNLSARAGRRRGQMGDGLRYLVSRPDIMLVVLLFFLVTSFTWNLEVMLAPMAAAHFERGPNGYGQLASALGVGTLIGALVATRRRSAPRQPSIIAIAAFLGVLQVALSFVSDFYLFLVMLVPVGLGMLTLLNMVNTTVQIKTDDAMRGRMSGFYALALNGGKPIGALVLGAVGHRFGPPAMFLVTGLFTVTVACGIGIWMLRIHRPPGRTGMQ
jgi:predicted MFS family arabinose efflux permease